MLRLLHLADLHLGWTPSFMPEPRRAERKRRRDALLRAAVDWSLRPEHRIGMVVIAGDLFETHTPDEALAASAVRELGRLVEAGIAVVTVPGNHDEITYHNSIYRRWADRWPGVLVQHPFPAHVTTLTVAGVPVHVYGLAYTGGLTPAQRPLTQFPKPDEPGLHLAVFHGVLGDWGGERSLPLDPEALGAAGYDYVALGHIHQHREHRLGRTTAVYCGAVESKDFEDPGVGHWTVVELDGAPGHFTARIERPPAPAQIAETVTVDAGRFDDPAALEAALLGMGGPERILRVRLTGALPFELDVDALAASLADRFYHLRIEDQTETVSDALLDRWAAQPTILGTFIRRMRRRLEQATGDEERRLVVKALRRGVHALSGGGAP
ncbi:MAG: DNA repair exonuclease [Limnochordaceae bacterium]|nr:DNA repair exonuclease [Limnochordaceae bacterium]